MGTVTIGANTHEVYSDLATAQIYLGAHLAAETWADGDDQFQSKVLVMSTRLFASLKWRGTPTVGNPEGVVWPRDATGVSDDGTTPQQILNGFWELAALIAEDPSLPNTASSGSNVQRAKGGEAEVWFFRSTLDGAPRLPLIVNDWIKAYIRGENGVFAEAFGTVDNYVSVFDNPPERSEGLS
jgi:hypothetical protein